MEKNNQKLNSGLTKGYVIGVDGGGTKTVTALADLAGKILKISKSGPSSPRNVGVKESAKNIAEGIKGVLTKIGKNEKILSTFIGLAAIEEEPRFKQEIKQTLFKKRGIFKIFKGKVEIGSDQIIAFWAGAAKKEGVVLISGTGCVAHGWQNKKDVKTSGWGYLADEGSAFWIGQKGLQAVFKDLDGRGPKTLITKLVLKQWKIPAETEDLIQKFYSENLTTTIPLLSILVDMAAKKKDKVAKEILIEAGLELALAAEGVIKKLDFQRTKFPLVLTGGVFKSKIVLDRVKKEIKKIAPKVELIQLKAKPVTGAVKLAIEQIQR